MTAFEKLKRRTALDGSGVADTILEDLCDSARAVIMSRRFPYGSWPDVLEPRYEDLQFRIALALYNKIGGEYEITHSENGVQRQWTTEDIPNALLFEITPVAGGLE